MEGNLSPSDTNFCHLSALLLIISSSWSPPCSSTLSWPRSSSWSLPSSSLSSLQEKQVGNGGQLILLPHQLLPSNDHCRLSQCHRQRHCHRHCHLCIFEKDNLSSSHTNYCHQMTITIFQPSPSSSPSC